MDPLIIASLIKAASDTAPSIFDRVFGGVSSSDTKIKKFVVKKYPDLKNYVSPPCVKLLKFAEDGTYHSVDQFRTHLYPDMMFKDRTEEDAFDHEFAYRLRYLVATGFFHYAEVNEYYITHLGAEFLSEARKKRDFKDVLP
jgi:hypothetical protein